MGEDGEVADRWGLPPRHEQYRHRQVKNAVPRSCRDIFEHISMATYLRPGGLAD